jgi:hypothetical protein
LASMAAKGPNKAPRRTKGPDRAFGREFRWRAARYHLLSLGSRNSMKNW